MTYTKLLNLSLGVEANRETIRKSSVSRDGFGQARGAYIVAPYDPPHQREAVITT